METAPPAPTVLAADPRTERLLYGHDPLPGIVAVERAGADRVAVLRRADGGGWAVEEAPFRPWLLAERPDPWAALRPGPEVTRLEGDHPLRWLVRFPGWPQFLDASQAGRDAGERFFRLRNPVEQYLVASGRTLFKGMVFDDLRRLALDIETLGLDPGDPAAHVIAAAVTTDRGEAHFLTLDTTEADLLARLSELLVALDPDVIEGHNLFNFDLPYLAARAARLGVPLRWGRDGSPLRIGEGKARFKVGALTLPFTPAYVFGRHVVDTYQQIQRYDLAGRLGSYALKRVMAQLYPEQEREVIPGDQIREVWRRGDLRRLEAYNVADARDVGTLSRLCLPTEFYQAQLLPRAFQAVATGGPGEKINDLMLRAYLGAGHGVPEAQRPRPYPGGHAELLETGAFGPVVKCDVESLYPSIMLAERIGAASDVLGASLPMLEDLTRRRLAAKAASRTGVGPERAVWEGLQSSFKVLINSFYGYLGYGQALFNDYDAAERVTLAGQGIIKRVVTELRATGALPIEVDTDGVYFVPPAGVAGPEAEAAYVERVGATLPTGIRLAHDGGYAGMLSLRLKNYALMDYDGTVSLKGSALRSRRLERCFRHFLAEAAADFIRGDREAAREAYFALGERIRRREVPVAEFSQWGALNDETAAKQPRLRRLRARLPASVASGERVETYERQDGELATVEEYAGDESIPYLLRRLREVAERFRELFPSEAAFVAFFPPLSARTDLQAAKAQEATQQLGLFG